MSSLSERLINLREKAGLSPGKAAEKLEIAEEVLKCWESGDTEPDTETVFKMAKLYCTTADMILFGGDGREASMTMFPKNAVPEFSPFADPKVLIGALTAFVGIGGILIMIMRAIGEGYDSFSDMTDYCGPSLCIFAGIAAAGILFAVITALVRRKKHLKNKNNDRL